MGYIEHVKRPNMEGLEKLGLILCVWFFWRLAKVVNLCRMYWRPCRADFVSYADGGYALITGAAGGIGKAMADELGAKGISLWLFDHNENLLAETTAELRQKYANIDVKSKTLDLRQLINEDVYKSLCDEIDAVKVGILFNCAGIAEYKVFMFNNNTHKELVSMNEINSTVPVLLYRAVLPQMVRRRKGLVMAMASASAMSPQPVMPAYGATKSYVLQLSRSLQNQFPVEYSGVLFHAFHPQFIASPMTKGTGWHKLVEMFFPISNIYPTAAEWIPQAMKTVGHGNGHSPGWLIHEPLIWAQAHLVPLLDMINRAIWPASKKYANDERFEAAVVNEENSRIFSTLMNNGDIFRE